jgi:superfamily I DNA/RNA helicase
MALSSEQQLVVDTIQLPDTSILLVDSIAGSGKTHTLVAAASRFRSALYIAYNKSAQLDAKPKFGPNTDVSTVHSMCYKPIVALGLGMPGIKSGPRKIDFFNFRSIDLPITYEDKLYVISSMDHYFASRFISIKEYITTYQIPDHIASAMTLYIQKMANKDIPCTFGFVLKYFHILLSRNIISMPSYDIIMLDEIQDSPEVTLEIFKLLQSPKKIGVGDPHQSIYGFNYAVNGFIYLRGTVDKTLRLTRSYRCSIAIATKVQTFCQTYFSPDMKFIGTDSDNTINSTLYLARTNGALIARMIELNRHNTPYNLTRKPQDIFGLLLTISSLKPGCKVFQEEFKFLLQDMEYYYAHPYLKADYISLNSYIASIHSADKSIVRACRTIAEYGGKLIFDAYKIAKAHYEAKATHHLTLSTASSAKGLEADKVVLSDDLDLSFLESETMSEEDIQSELRIRYVAISRAKKELLGADFLE